MKPQFLFFLLLFISCSNDDLQLDLGQVSIDKIVSNDKIKPTNLDYTISFNLDYSNEYCYLLYRTVSNAPNSFKHVEVDSNDLIDVEIIEKGLVSELKSSELNPNYKELIFRYDYSTKKSPLEANSSKVVVNKIFNIDNPITIHKLIHPQDKITTAQDIGLIVYKFPPSKVYSKLEYFPNIEQYKQQIKLHDFNAPSFFKSKEYLLHLVSGYRTNIRFEEYL